MSVHITMLFVSAFNMGLSSFVLWVAMIEKLR